MRHAALRIPLAFLFLGGWLGQAERSAVARQLTGPDVGQLAKVTLFAFAGVGFASVKSAGEKGYNAIMSRPNRQELLEKVFETGTPAARSYALVGINHLNAARFKELAAELRSSKTVVSTAHGCLLSPSTLGAVVEQIEAGGYARYDGTPPKIRFLHLTP
jgi:hypothetical protein